ncbi:hypothetical protein Y032_0235g3162, partial [Ancylostoma ceylanicum]
MSHGFFVIQHGEAFSFAFIVTLVPQLLDSFAIWVSSLSASYFVLR